MVKWLKQNHKQENETKVNVTFLLTIYADKTVGLLYEGARNNSNNNQLFECKKEKFKTIRLDGEGNAIFMDGSAGNTDKLKCISCDRDSTVQSECSNCNLNLCEYCGISCGNCLEAHICKHCVELL